VSTRHSRVRDFALWTQPCIHPWHYVPIGGFVGAYRCGAPNEEETHAEDLLAITPEWRRRIVKPMLTLTHDSQTAVADRAAIARGDGPVPVLFLIDQLCAVGGAEAALLRILRRLPRTRFRPIVATFRCDASFPGLADFPAELRVLPLRCTYDFNAIRVALRLRGILRREKVRIVHTFFETSDLWGGLVARLSAPVALISSRRDLGIQRTWKHRVAYRVLGRIFDQVHTVSERVRQETIRRDRLPPGRVVTVYNGVDFEADSSPLSREAICGRLGVDPASAIVISVCNIRRLKGIDVLIRAAAMVCASRPRAVFVVVGAAPDTACLAELQDMRAAYGLCKNFYFWGPERHVASLLKAADVFALLSRTEGFSNAIVEAMTCGLPCVVTDVGGNREAVRDGECGWVVPPDDQQSAADRIGKLIDEPEIRRRMGGAALAIAQRNFTAAGMIERLTELYDKLLEENQPG
jgi:glycosyltransferase involved in cell wall biosynthesis